METESTPTEKSPAAPGRRGRRWWPRFRARVRTIWRRLLMLLGPFLLTGLIVAGVWLLNADTAYELLVITGASFLGFGTTVIFSSAVLGEQISLGTWEIAIWVIYLNAAAAFLYAFNLDLLEKVPLIGPYLRRARKNTGLLLEGHPWIRRLAEFGVGLFVVSPLPGSGQLGGCFVGRVIGLSKRQTFLIVTLAGTIVAVLYALLGSEIKQVLDDNEVKLWYRVVGAALLIAFMWIMFKMLRYLGREDLEIKKPSGEETDAAGG